MKYLIVILLILIYLSVIIAQGDVDIPVTYGGARISSSGGGSRSPDIENFIRQIESWKTNYPERFDYLKTLLYKQNFTTTKYVAPAVWLYYPSKNKTISRYDPIEIGAIVLNRNPIEIRRALYLTLEIQEPGETGFKPAKAVTQIIQVNEYDDREKTCLRVFPDLNSFEFLSQVGVVRLRVDVTDGQYKYDSSIQTNDPEHGYYGDLILNVSNIPPAINNTSMTVSPNVAKWDDYIQYTAYFKDTEKVQNIEAKDDKTTNPIQVTLHVFKDSLEVFNMTKPFPSSDPISFSTRDANIFKESDSGDNFTYRYSCSDGLNSSQTEIRDGPRIRPNPRIRVEDFSIIPEDSNYYWWQKYVFRLKAKSENPEGIEFTANLFIDTVSHPNKYITSKTVYIPSNNLTSIDFSDAQPFDMTDCDHSFSYYFTYSAPDQDGQIQSEHFHGANINPRLIRYEIYSPVVMTNLLLIMGLALLVGIIIERKFYRKEGR